MHKIVINRGVWEKILNERLINENCPNSHCKYHNDDDVDGHYAYPFYFENPKCTECSQDLYGLRIKNKPQFRINYYLDLIRTVLEDAN